MFPNSGAKLNLANPLSNGLTGVWLMDAYGGGLVNEFVNDHNGTITGADWVPSGLDFTASGDKVETVNAGKLLGSEGTITFGYKYTNTPSFYYFAVIDDDFNEFSLVRTPANSYCNFYINSSNATLSDVTFFDGSYHDLAFTWDASANERKIYVDGLLSDTNTTSFTWDAAGIDDHKFFIGGRDTGVDRYAGGIISYFYIYDRVLSDEKINSINFNPYQIFERRRFRSLYLPVSTTYQPVIFGPF